MSQIALFHSHLGVRAGITDAAERLRAAGHEVLVVDQFDGQTFDDHAQAASHTEEIGFPELMRRAIAAVERLDDGFLVAGFSNGAGMAEHIATQRRVAGVLMLSGALPLELLGVGAWPAGVPAQIHYTLDDPFRDQEWIDGLADAIRAAGAPLELFDYPGTGHLFTDASLPGEYDPQATELLWQRVIDFCAAPRGGAGA